MYMYMYMCTITPMYYVKDDPLVMYNQLKWVDLFLQDKWQDGKHKNIEQLPLYC